MKKDKIIKSNLSTLLKKFSNTDVISSFSKEHEAGAPKNISLSKITDNSYLSKARVNQAKLEKVANSINERGFNSPLYIRKKGDEYEALYPRIAYKAAKKVKLESVPCILIKINEEDLLLFLAAKLLQHKDSSIIEMSLIFNQIKAKLKYSQKEIALAMGLSRSQVTNIMRLINMPESILNDVGEGKLSFGHVRAISALKVNDMVKIVDRIYDENLSVHEVERIVYEKKHRVSFAREQKRLEKKYKCDVLDNPKRVTFVFESDEDKENFIKKIS